MSDGLEGEPRTRWSEVSGGIGAATAYQQRFDDLAASGVDIHGEAAFVEALLPPPARVLDAGCGTGRVATQLTALGYRCVGVDADPDMIAVAEQRDTKTSWVRQDLSRLQLRSQAFDVAVLAGNVVPLLAPGTLLQAVERVAAHLRPGGLVVAGFGLDAAHLPPGCPVTPLEEYDRACTVAGLSVGPRYSTWDKQVWRPDAGYVVAVNHLAD
ncbi:class I SAM-dependent methyltransferase [Phycicoccus sp. M110.8]|uniref:class I SAM-dependent methyltransferase n=1 Tax=Phycicoccus sp. M110.8 TaxID=3075433 RepID=UPI0028FDBB07|nr:class I SAM-dependent methyltransferase [Phycicoccus sp. M110.8]MDU0312099.1 class I SAM-dependent methyltransferase [Phycicoccus sp. M110.8]HET8768487.1 class I SAM-dependent methyltransferase [Pedococcus sp.]